MSDENKTWLYTMDRSELEDYAISMRIDPDDYLIDEALIDAIVEALEHA